MQDYIGSQDTHHSHQTEAIADITHWLHVSGDLDDFIYYGEEPRESER